MRTQPGAQERPKPLDCLDMDFAEAIFFITGIFAHPRTNNFVCIAPFEGILDAVLVGVNQTTTDNRRLDQEFNCRYKFSSIRITTSPPRSIMPKIGGFSFSSVPRPRTPLRRQ